MASSDQFAGIIVRPPSYDGVIAMSADAVTIRVSSAVAAGNQWKYGLAVRSAVNEAFVAAGIEAPAADFRRRPGTPDGR